MGKSRRSVRQMSRRKRTLAVFGVTIGILLPFCYLSSAALSDASSQNSVVSEERSGVAYVRPLTELLDSLATTQSAAVQGLSVDSTGIRAAVARVSTVDSVHGAGLGTQERWSGLKKRVMALSTQRVSGERAFAQYSSALDLTEALVSKVGDTSTLILDPALDSYHLVDASLLRIPSLIVDSGEMADLTWLGSRSSGGSPADGRVFAARDRVSTSAAALDSDLQTSFDATASTTLAPDLAGPIDRLRSVVGTFAPVTSLATLPVDLSQPAQVGRTQQQLSAAALRLDSAMLTELDALLRTRGTQVNKQHLEALGAVAVAAAAVGWLLWAFVPSRSRSGAGADGREAPPNLAGRHRASPPSHPDAQPPDDLVDARELLPAEELTRVGRAVRPSRRGPARDAQ